MLHQYSLGYDNVGFEKVKAKQGCQMNKEVYVWTTMVAFHHRATMCRQDPRKYFTAQQMKVEPFLPTKSDFRLKEERMAVIIKRILIAHMARYHIQI